MKKNIFAVLKKALVTAAIALILPSCSNIMSNGGEDSSSSAKSTDAKATVTFNVTTPSRTALPSVNVSNYTYTLKGTPSGGTEQTLCSGVASDKITAAIATGEWTFTVTGYSGSTAVLSGTKTMNVTTSTAVSLKLGAATGGTGSVSVTLRYPAELGVATVKAALYDSFTASLTDSGTALTATTGSAYNSVTFTASDVASGVTKYLAFYLYDSSSSQVSKYTETVYVVNGLTSESTYTIVGSTTTASVTVQKNGEEWTDSGLELSVTDGTKSYVMTSGAGTALYTVNVPSGSTYTVYVNGSATTKTITDSASSVSLNYAVPTLYPAQDATDAFADTQLVLAFSDTPTLVADKTVTIYEGSGDSVATTETDTISVNSASADGEQPAQSGQTVKVGNQQLVRVDGTTVYIQPHYNGTTSATKLQTSTTYTVDVSEAIAVGSGYDGIMFPNGTTTWSFTTKAAPSLSTTMTVSNATSGNSADFFSVYGALFAVAKNGSASTTYEIDIADGTYYELLSITAKSNQTIILHGSDSNTKGDSVVIEYVNNNHMNNSADRRPVFYMGNGNLILENVTFKNLTARATSYTKDGYYGGTLNSASGGNYQAETIYFNSASGKISAYNSTFESLQDTLLTKGKLWFYGCAVKGDVDFMWGYSDVALFENCDITCLYDSKASGSSYLFETRVGKPASSGVVVGKGYVLLNSTVTVESGVTAYFGRRASSTPASNAATYYDQAALVNVVFAGSGSVDSSHYYSKSNYTPYGIPNSDYNTAATLYGTFADVGWKEYNISGTASTLSAASEICGVITSAEYAAEYSGRRAILNRFYNVDSKAYAVDSSTHWNIDTLISERGYTVASDSSSETLSGESEVTSVVWNTGDANLSQTRNQTFYMYTDLSTTTTAPTGDALYNYLYCDGSKNDYIQGSLELYGTAAIYIPVTTASTATIAFTKGAGTLTIAGKDYTANGNVEIDCSTATLVTLNEIKYIEVRVNGTAGGTADKYIITSVTVVTASSSSSSSSGTTASDSDIIIDNGTVISDSDTSSRSNTLSVIKGETPTGYAGVGYSSSYSSSSYTNGTVTVSTRSDLVKYAKASGYFIIVDGMIDMTDGMLPSVGGGTTDELDSFVAGTTFTSGNTYSSYSDWVAKYAAACSLTSDDEKENTSTNTSLYADLWKLSDNYKKQIQLVIASNTAIVGANADSGIKGATISISGVSNVVLRNLNIRDAYDPFPHHEVKDDGVTSDGYNAQWDCITVQGDCSYIWIDHCTFEDTMSLAHVYTGGTGGTSEKWQTYDGLLDIKGGGQYITVSYCKFKNHDKTSLIGNTDGTETYTKTGESSNTTVTSGYRKITYHHNYFYNCGQRLPMVRYTTMHLYNNLYAASSPVYTQQYAVGVRTGSIIYSENNYFDSGILYAFSGDSDSSKVGEFYSDGDSAASGVTLYNSSKGISNSNGKTLFSSAVKAYNYTPETAATVQANLPSEVGAGAVTISDAAVSTTAIELDQTTASVAAGSTVTLTATVTPSNSTDSVTWSSNAESVATVSSSGVVTGVAEGDATITVTSGSYTATCTVTVTANDISIAYETTSYTLDLGGTKTGTNTLSITGANASDASVSYESSDTSVATVDASSGEVTAMAIGVATITATESTTEKKATYSLVVKDTTAVKDTYEITLTTAAKSASSAGNYDFGLFSVKNGKWNDGTHGWAFSNESTITFHVNGASTITLGSCNFNSSADFTATAAAGTYSESQAVLKSCSSSYTFTYSASDAADITITFSGTTYVPYVKVASASYSSTIKASALFDFRTLFSELPTSSSSASGSIKADGGEITYSKMYYKDITHGAYMYQTSTITFTVSGACTIYLGKDAYNGATYTIAAVNSENASVDSSLSATTIDAGIQNTDSAATLASGATDLTATGAAAVSFKYTGTSAATITISVTGGSATNYLPAMQVVF